MDYHSIISGLYYLLIGADGQINEKELLLGKKIAAAEGLEEAKFISSIERFKSADKTVLYNNCLANLKKLDKERQIRCVAWLCVIANADGFMDKQEWVLIYKIYHNELHLSLDAVMKTQRELNKIVHGKDFLSFGVKVDK
jgi:uncharacterized tellurite resistance protein B-like protein